MPTVEAWLKAAVADAERRGLAPLKPLLETLARSTAALREADERFRASGVEGGTVLPPAGGSHEPSAHTS